MSAGVSGFAGRSDIRQQTGCMNNRENVGPIASESVNDAVRTEDDFPVGIALHLRDHAPRARELLQSLD